MFPISCGIQKDIRILLLLAFPLFWFLRQECDKQLSSPSQNTNIFLMIIILFLGKILSGILEIIVQINGKKKNFFRRKSISFNNFASFKITPFVVKTLEVKNYYIIHIFILSLVQLLSVYWSDFFLTSETEKIPKNHLKGFQIIPTTLFLHWFVYHRKLYKHQLVSFIVIALCFIAILINSFMFYSKNQIDLALYIIQLLAVYTLNPLRDSIEKWFMEIKDLSPFFILFYEGLSGIIYMAIILGFIPIMPPSMMKNDSIEDFLESIKRLFSNNVSILLVIGDIFATFGYYIFLILISKCYSPTYKCIVENVYACVQIIYHEIEAKQFIITNSLIYFIATIPILFFSLVYTEIIIINMCGFKYNTQREIIQRGIQEYELADQIDLFDIDQVF